MEIASFSRLDLLQDRVALKGNLSSCLGLQYRSSSAVFVQFSHLTSKQRVFCILLNQTDLLLIVNNVLDVSPKPLAVQSATQTNELVISRNDGKNCTILFENREAFSKWQGQICEALAEVLCCDAMKPLPSGRLSAVRMNRCLNVCKLLTRDEQLLRQVKRLRSIRSKINETMQEMRAKECRLASPDIRKVKASCNIIRFVYPTVRCDPDLAFLTEQLRGGKCSAEDLEQICRLLLHVEQEDKGEFLRMVKLSATTSNGTDVSPRTGTGHAAVSPNRASHAHLQGVDSVKSARESAHRTPMKVKRVSWDAAVQSNEKRSRAASRTRRSSRMNGISGNLSSSNISGSSGSARQSPSKLDVAQAPAADSVILSAPSDNTHTEEIAPTAETVLATAPIPVQVASGTVTRVLSLQSPVPAPAPEESVNSQNPLSLSIPDNTVSAHSVAPPPRSSSVSPIGQLAASTLAAHVAQTATVPAARTIASPVPQSPVANACRSPSYMTPPSTPLAGVHREAEGADYAALVTNATPVLTVSSKAVQQKALSKRNADKAPTSPVRKEELIGLYPHKPAWLNIAGGMLLLIISCVCLYAALFGAPLSLSYSSHSYGSNGYSTVTFSLSSSASAVVSTSPVVVATDDIEYGSSSGVAMPSVPAVTYVPMPAPLPAAALNKAPVTPGKVRANSASNTQQQLVKHHHGSYKQQQDAQYAKNAFNSLARVAFSPLRLLRNILTGIGSFVSSLLFRRAVRA